MEPVIHWRENVFVQEKWELRKIKKDKQAVCIVSCFSVDNGSGTIYCQAKSGVPQWIVLMNSSFED